MALQIKHFRRIWQAGKQAGRQAGEEESAED